MGHLNPSYISSEEYDFLISADWEVPVDISLIDLTYAVAFILFCARYIENGTGIIVDEQPSWTAPLQRDEITGMVRAVDFIVDQKLTEHKRSGEIAA